jgi:biotin transport system substrate-specific component
MQSMQPRQAQPGPTPAAGVVPTLVDVILPDALTRYRDILLIVACGSLMGVLAQVAVPLPFTPVPVTGQTLGVLLIGALLGSRRGALAMLVHLAEGLAGLPVFAEANSAWTSTRMGVPTIVGPTAGYLLAFPVAAFVVGWLAERGWDRRLLTAAAAMLVGQAVIYGGGLTWLAAYVGWERAIPLGMLPFLSGDALKLVLAAMALPTGWRLVGRLGVPPEGA